MKFESNRFLFISLKTFLPDPISRQGFLWCSGGVSTRGSCEQGQVFNARTSMCEFDNQPPPVQRDACFGLPDGVRISKLFAVKLRLMNFSHLSSDFPRWPWFKTGFPLVLAWSIHQRFMWTRASVQCSYEHVWNRYPTTYPTRSMLWPSRWCKLLFYLEGCLISKIFNYNLKTFLPDPTSRQRFLWCTGKEVSIWKRKCFYQTFVQQVV